MKLIFSDRALSDLEQIGDYISREAPENARRYVQKLINRAHKITLFVNAGRIVPEYQDEQLREVIIDHYRMVYEINRTKKKITIITIFESHHLISDDLK